MEDGDPVADAEELGEVGADEEDGLAPGGQLADPFVDLGFADDVDAARRLVQEEDLGLLVEEPGQGHLLLVPSREIDDLLVRAPGLDLHFPDPAPNGLSLGVDAEEAAPADKGENR